LSWRIQKYGERALLLEDLEEPLRLGLARHAESSPPEHLEECVPGHDGLLFIFRRPVPAARLAAWLDGAGKTAPLPAGGRLHRIEVVYDGPDLASVAEAAGLSVAEVVARHSGGSYRVRLCGFAPGFPYLDGLDPRLRLPRRDQPRTRIEPGAVAVGGPYAGIYPVAGPGGWHLLGRTDFVLFDKAAAARTRFDPRAVFPLQAGDRVVFSAVEAAVRD